MNLDAILEVKNLTIKTQENNAQQGKTLLNKCSFKLKQAQTLAIVGESGSGKSLTALSILQLTDKKLLTTGEILFQQKNLLTLTEKQLQQIRGKKIAIVMQDSLSSLNPLYKVKDLLNEILSFHQMSKSEKAQRMTELLQDVGLTDIEQKLNMYPHQLSGGQRQRVMIAMALAQKPEILIADEPTSALDATLQHKVLHLICQLKQKYKMSLILISHDIKLVRQYADDILILKQGECVEYHQADHIFKHPQHSYTKQLLEQQKYSYRPVVADLPKCLEIRNLHVNYTISSIFSWRKRTFSALKNIDFQLKQGENLAILGESGSGKSTLALALARLIQSEGEIILYPSQSHGEKIDLNTLSQKALRPYRKEIQIMFQDPFSSLNPRWTVEELICEGLYVQGYAQPEILNRFEQMMQKIYLDLQYRHHCADTLSGGQRQRVALARALILRPKILILDEPTSALDKHTQAKIIQLLQEIQQQEQMSLIFISHDLSAVQGICHSVLFLDQGEISAYQTMQAFIEQPANEKAKHFVNACLSSLNVP